MEHFWLNFHTVGIAARDFIWQCLLLSKSKLGTAPNSNFSLSTMLSYSSMFTSIGKQAFQTVQYGIRLIYQSMYSFNA